MNFNSRQRELVEKYGYYSKIKDLEGIFSRRKLVYGLENEKIFGIKVGGRAIRVFVPSLERLLK